VRSAQHAGITKATRRFKPGYGWDAYINRNCRLIRVKQTSPVVVMQRLIIARAISALPRDHRNAGYSPTHLHFRTNLPQLSGPVIKGAIFAGVRRSQ
jgi:hypothetical protein